MNGTSGLSAWRWLFILEGLPSLLSAVAVFFLLPDYPETAGWLSSADKRLASDRLRLEGSHGHSSHMTWADAKATLLDLRLYAHYIARFPLPSPSKTLPLTHSPDLLRHLHALLLPLPLYPHHNRRPRLLRPTSPTNDRPALRRKLRGYHPRLLVRGPLQRARTTLRHLRNNRRNRLPRLRRAAPSLLPRALRLPDCRRERLVQLHSSTAGLAEQ